MVPGLTEPNTQRESLAVLLHVERDRENTAHEDIYGISHQVQYVLRGGVSSVAELS